MLGFVSRICSDFNNPTALKSLLLTCSLDFIIWSPYLSDPTEGIGAIQNPFFRFLAFKCVQCQQHTSYALLLTLTNLETLQIRRLRLLLYFTFKLLNGIINCSEEWLNFIF